MRRHSSPLPWVVPGLLLLFLTLRPVAALDELMQRALAPVRKLGELAAPLVLLRHAGSSSAEKRLRQAALAEQAAGAQLLKDLAKGSLPTEAELLRERRIVHGAVIGRVKGQPDFLRVELRDTRGVRPGFPVACGNAFVGRVVSVDARESLAVVELVTGANFHVGGVVRQPKWEDGRADDTPVQMTVGGLFVDGPRAARGDRQLQLAVDHPSDRAIQGGLVRVDERYGETPEIQRLSLGLHLGELTKDESYWGIRPKLDYEHGLFHVVVLCPLDESLGSGLLFASATEDDQWLRVKPIGLGDPSPYRSTAKVRAGSGRGVQAGAAVLDLASRLVGRISKVGPWSSDVSFLDDPGFSVVAVAANDLGLEPFVLGRLVSMGRQNSGDSIRMRWFVRVQPRADWRQAAGPDGLLAKLFTGSGEEGLPSGFAFGTAMIPLDAEPGDSRVIELSVENKPALLHSLYVRTQRVGQSSQEPL